MNSGGHSHPEPQYRPTPNRRRVDAGNLGLLSLVGPDLSDPGDSMNLLRRTFSQTPQYDDARPALGPARATYQLDGTPIAWAVTVQVLM